MSLKKTFNQDIQSCVEFGEDVGILRGANTSRLVPFRSFIRPVELDLRPELSGILRQILGNCPERCQMLQGFPLFTQGVGDTQYALLDTVNQ